MPDELQIMKNAEVADFRTSTSTAAKQALEAQRPNYKG